MKNCKTFSEVQTAIGLREIIQPSPGRIFDPGNGGGGGVGRGIGTPFLYGPVKSYWSMINNFLRN